MSDPYWQQQEEDNRRRQAEETRQRQHDECQQRQKADQQAYVDKWRRDQAKKSPRDREAAQKKKQQEKQRRKNKQNEKQNSSSCFVATAAYGDANHPDVEFLRAFRDTILLPKKTGKAFVAFYYWCGPFLADIVLKLQLRPIVKDLLKRLVSSLRTRFKGL